MTIIEIGSPTKAEICGIRRVGYQSLSSVLAARPKCHVYNVRL